MGHSHDDVPEQRATPAVRRLLLLALVPLALLTLAGLVMLWPARATLAPTSDLGFGLLVHGTVASLTEKPCPNAELDESSEDVSEFAEEPPGRCADARVLMTNGPTKGQEEILDLSIGRTSVSVRTGSKVVLNYEASAPPGSQYQITDVQRGPPLLALGLLFSLAVVVLGRRRGLAALAGLAITFFVLIRFMLPALLAGESPVQVALVAAAVIMFVSLYITHGFTSRTSAAVIGTLSSLVLTGLLAAVFTAWASFSGLVSEEASFISATQAQVDLRGLFLAGVVIGSLGVLDDVTVTQATAVWELRRANAAYGVRELYRAGVRIGRDHIASTVNTLVLAYAGASLPLLILFTVSGRGIGQTLTNEVVAQEVVRSLVGGIGLVAAVPITTLTAALLAVRGEKPGVPVAGRRRRKSEEIDAEVVEWWQKLRDS